MELTGDEVAAAIEGWRKFSRLKDRWPDAVRALRGKLTQQQFADAVGCHMVTICKIERGHLCPGGLMQARLMDYVAKVSDSVGDAEDGNCVPNTRRKNS